MLPLLEQRREIGRLLPLDAAQTGFLLIYLLSTFRQSTEFIYFLK